MPLMTKTDPFEFAWRACMRWLAAAGCALVLAACGPGTGGTGTGPISATFAGSSAPAVGAPSMGSCTGDCTTVQLRLQETLVELAAACGRFTHEGGWSVGENGIARIAGTWTTQSGATVRTVPATLQLQFTGDPQASQQVVFVVLDEAGAALFGPQTLQRTAAPGAPLAASCA
jgi:hypothetical protein